MEFYAKIYQVKNETMLAACDRELHGKTFREGGVVLFIKDEFYKGLLVDEAALEKLLSSATIINLVGKRCVAIAEKMELVQGKLVIEGVPHVQIFEM